MPCSSNQKAHIKTEMVNFNIIIIFNNVIMIQYNNHNLINIEGIVDYNEIWRRSDNKEIKFSLKVGYLCIINNEYNWLSIETVWSE